MVTTQTYYLTAILALVLSGVSLAVGLANLIISQRNRLVDASEKKDSRAAEQAYKYSKEVQACNAQHAWLLTDDWSAAACPDRS